MFARCLFTSISATVTFGFGILAAKASLCAGAICAINTYQSRSLPGYTASLQWCAFWFSLAAVVTYGFGFQYVWSHHANEGFSIKFAVSWILLAVAIPLSFFTAIGLRHAIKHSNAGSGINSYGVDVYHVVPSGPYTPTAAYPSQPTVANSNYYQQQPPAQQRSSQF